MKKNKQKNRGNNYSKLNSPVTRNEEQTTAPMQELGKKPPYEETTNKRHRSVSPMRICMLVVTVVVAGIITWYWWGTLKSSEYDAKATFSVIMPNDTLTVNRGDHVTIKDELLIAEGGRKAIFSSDMRNCLTNDTVDDGPREYATPNKNGTKQFYQYSKKDDKKRAGFVFTDDSTKKVKLAFGEMLEVGKQSKPGHEVFALGNHQIKPAFKLDKNITYVSEEGHEAIRLAKLQVYGNLLMVNVEDTGDSSKVVIYPEAGNDSIISISRNEFGKDVSGQLKDASNLTFRVSCNNHISSIVTADRVKIFYSPKAEAKSNVWAVVFTVLAVLQLAGLWFLFKRRRGKAQHDENEADSPVMLSCASLEETSAEERELHEVNQQIENLNTDIQSFRQRMNALPAEESKVSTQEVEAKDAVTNAGENQTVEQKLLIYGPESLTDEEKVELVKEKILATNTYDNDEKVIKLRKDLEQFSDQSEDIIIGKFNYLLPIIKEACKDGVNTERAVSEDAMTEAEHHDVPAATSHKETRQALEEQLNVAQGNLETLEAKKKLLEDAISQKSAGEAMVQSLNQQLRELQNQNSELSVYKQKAEDKIRQANEAAERRVKKAEDDARNDIQEARRDAQQARDEAKQTREKVTNEFKGQIDGLNTTIGEQKTKINQLSDNLSKTIAKLDTTTEELESAKVTIQDKDNALERFHRTIKEVDPAKEYAEQLEKLLELGGNVEVSALKLSYKKDIDDYLIPKYIARFRNAISGLEMNVFTADVFNAAKAQFVYKTQMLATFYIGNREAFHQSMKMYFFDNYLKKYVDALVVLNETMIGTQYTVDGVTSNDVKDFVGYRAALATVLKALEVDVDYVKIMDKSDDNLALTVVPKELPDIDCPKNSICQMENCIVYLHGSDKPNEKIEVIVKN